MTLRLHLGPLDRVRVRVVLEPLLSAAGAAQAALLPAVTSVHAELVGASRWYLGRNASGAAQLRSLLVSPVTPVVVYSLLPDVDRPLPEHDEYLRSSAAAAALDQELHALVTAGEPVTWAGPRGRTGTWMHGHADVLVGLAHHLAPHWARAEPLLAREVERVGAAVVRGTLRELLGSLSPRVHWEGDVLCLPAADELEADVTGRTVVLAPRVDGTDLLSTILDGSPDALFLSYRVPGLLGRGGPTPVVDHLEQLLTAPRALLVRSLDRPRTMGELSALLQLAPSSVTHHCALEAAGLVLRERRGQHVRVHRTPRGDELVDHSS